MTRVSRGSHVAEHDHVVLVVDDDADILDSLKDALELSLDHVEVRVAHNGREALEALVHNGIELIITDYRMPGMTGSELIERAHELAPGVPCVLMSAFPGSSLVATPAQRPDAFIPKPMNFDHLVETSRRLLAGRGRAAA